MALLQNNYLQNQLPIRWRQGSAVGMSLHSVGKGDRRNQSSQFGNLASTPGGAYAPTAWILPIKAGSMASRNEATGEGSFDPGSLIEGRNLAGALSGAGNLSSSAQLVVSMVAALVGSGTITVANAQAFLAMAADLVGSAAVAAILTAKAHASADVTGDGTADGSTIRATGTMDAEITVTGATLSTANVASAVWGALASASSELGTMGGALAAAGAAGDPWSTFLPGSYPAGTAGDIIGNLAEHILTHADGIEDDVTLQGALRALLSTLTGKASGGGGPVITFRNPDDTADRVTMTVDEDGNRSGVTLNV